MKEQKTVPNKKLSKELPKEVQNAIKSAIKLSAISAGIDKSLKTHQSVIKEYMVANSITHIEDVKVNIIQNEEYEKVAMDGKLLEQFQTEFPKLYARFTKLKTVAGSITFKFTKKTK
jgi:hypothetical protein